MLDRFSRLFELPEIDEDDNKSYHVRLIIITANLLLLMLPVMVIANLLDPNGSRMLIVSDVVTFLFILSLRQWTYKTKKATAGIIMIAVGIGIATWGSTLDGMITPFAMIIFVVWAVYSSLVFGLWGYISTTAIVSIIIGMIMFAEYNGWLVSPETSVSLTDWVKSVSELLLVTTVAYSSRRITLRSFQKARQEMEERKRAEEAMLVMTERENMGRDLHDGLGQTLGFISTQTNAVDTLLQGGQIQEARKLLRGIEQASNEAAAEVRQHILGLQLGDSERPARVEFFTALRAYIQQYQKRYQIEVNLSLPENTSVLEMQPGVEAQLLKVIQEAMTNAAKHSGAQLILISMERIHNSIHIMISDNGIGFELNADGLANAPVDHFGLTIMRRRIEQAQGTFEIRSAPSKGTLIFLTLPCQISSENDFSSLRGLRVVLADDHPLFLEGLRNMLVARGILVVGTASNGKEAAKKVTELKPDILIMDVNMPVMNGIDATRAIKQIQPDLKIMILSVSNDDEELYYAMVNGASGFLLKDTNEDILLSKLLDLSHGEAPLSPGVNTRLVKVLKRVAGQTEYVGDNTNLTVKQNRILQLVRKGKTYKEIGNIMGLSVSTIKYHMAQILQQLHLNTRKEAIRYLEQNEEAERSDGEGDR